MTAHHSMPGQTQSGAPSNALRGVQRNPLKNQSANQYSAINLTAAAPIPMIHHMRTAFEFVLQSIRSTKSRLLTSAPTVVATIFLARDSRANAGHRGCV